jgi:DNA-binding CsgD family transcriptional regulator
MKLNNIWQNFWGHPDLETADEMFQRILQNVNSLGFAKFYYEHKLPFPFGESRWFSAGSAPLTDNSWLIAARRFVETGQKLEHDSIIPFAQVFQPLLTSLNDSSTLPLGFLVPISGYARSRAMFCVYRFCTTHAIEPAFSRDNLLSLAHSTHWSLTNASAHALQHSPVLSERECEVLRWTADGKTAEEVGLILDITNDTVNYHLKMARSKLFCVSKAACVAKALALGLI